MRYLSIWYDLLKNLIKFMWKERKLFIIDLQACMVLLMTFDMYKKSIVHACSEEYR